MLKRATHFISGAWPAVVMLLIGGLSVWSGFERESARWARRDWFIGVFALVLGALYAAVWWKWLRDVRG